MVTILLPFEGCSHRLVTHVHKGEQNQALNLHFVSKFLLPFAHKPSLPEY